MISYYCIVNLPGVPVREITAIDAADDAAARHAMSAVAVAWPGFETIALYEGERLVSITANPTLGFATKPLDLELAA